MDKMPPKDIMPPKKPSMALFVWLMIFLFIALLVIFKLNPAGKYEQWEQTRFEKELKAGNVVSADITPESDRIMYVQGEYRKTITLSHEGSSGKIKKNGP
jgi:predicted secreted protein